MDVIERIFYLMSKHSVTAAQLSRETDLSTATFTQWKQGKQRPSTDAVIKIANYFGVTTDYLLKGEEPKNEKENGVMNRT